jgi:hypothetical protein
MKDTPSLIGELNITYTHPNLVILGIAYISVLWASVRNPTLTR